MRRRERKDQLLADEPPRALGISIAVVALLLTAAVVAGASMTYQQKINTTIAIQPAGSGLRGEALLPPDQVVQVREGQRVIVDLNSSGDGATLTGGVASIQSQNRDGLYEVEIAFPDSPASINALRLQGAEYPATIYTQKIKVFARVFNVFRGLSGK